METNAPLSSSRPSWKTSIWFTSLHTLGTSGTSVVIGFLSSVLIARALGPDGKGSLDLLINSAALLAALLGLGLPTGIIYIVAQKQAPDRHLWLFVLLASAAQGALAYLLLSAFRSSGWLAALLPPATGRVDFTLVALAVTLTSLSGCGSGFLVGRQQIVQSNRIYLISRLVGFGLTAAGFLGIALSDLSLNYRVFFVFSLAASTVLTAAYAWAVKPAAGWQTKAVAALLKFSTPYYLGSLLQFLNYRVDLFLVNYFRGPAAVGVYALAASLAQLIWLVSNAFATNLLPKVASGQNAEASRAHTLRMARVVLYVSLLLALLLGAAAYPLLARVYGVDFSAALVPLLVLLPGIVAYSLMNVLSAYIAGSGKPGINLRISAAGLVVTLALDLLWIPRWGILGAAAASTAAYTLSTLLTVVYAGRSLKTSLRSFLAVPCEDIDWVRALLKRGRSAAGEQRGTGVVLLTNFIPPYRLALYENLARLRPGLRIFVSTEMETNRDWQPEFRRLDVTRQKTINLRQTWRHPQGFSEKLDLHLPVLTFFELAKVRPRVIISAEMGLRTLLAAVYARVSGARLIIWATLSERTEQGRGSLRDFVRRRLVRSAGAVIVNGASGRRYVQGLGCLPERIVEIPYVSDLAFANAEERPETLPGSIRLLYVGQLNERKGIIPFCRALAGWAAAHPELQVRLLAAGDGPARGELEALACPANFTVELLGSVAYSQLERVYHQADLLVFPTLADEWGLVVNEALSAGLPVLGSIYSQAVDELVVEGENGWRFTPDQEDYLQLFDRVFSDWPEHWPQMRAAARRSTAGLTPEFAAQQLDHLIAALDTVHWPGRRPA